MVKKELPITAEELQAIIPLIKNENRVVNENTEHRLSLRIVDESGFDNMTDEEIDERYRPRKANQNKTMAPLFIYLILKEHSNWNCRLTQKEIIEYLYNKYEIELERKAVSRHLESLIDADLNIWTQDRTGYWYSEEDLRDF